MTDRCEYSDLHPNQCHHCNPTPTTTTVTTIDRIETALGRPAPQYRYTRGQHGNNGHTPTEWATDNHTIVCDHNDTDSLCPDCATRLERMLGDVPAMWQYLQDALIKDTRFIQQGSKIGVTHDPDEAPVEFNIGASRAINQLAAALGGDPIRQSRRWLATFPERLLAATIADQAAAISRAMEQAQRIVERPKDLIYLGQCWHCGHTLTGARDDTELQCHRCGLTHDTADLRQHALTEGANRWLTERELLTALPDLTHTMLDRWYRRHGLAVEDRTRPRWEAGELTWRTERTYRLGDVTDRLQQHQDQQQAREVVTTHQLATRCGVSAATIRKWAERGHITPITPGARPLMFTELEARRVETTRGDAS